MIGCSLSGGLCLGIISATASGGLPFLVDLTGTIFQEVQNQTTSPTRAIQLMIGIVLAMLAIGIISLISAFASKICLSKLSARQVMQIRQSMFVKIQAAALADLAALEHGSLLTRITTDVYNFSLYYFYKLINVIPAILRVIVFVLMTIALNYLMGLVLLILSIFLYVIAFLMSRRSVEYFRLNLAKIDRLNMIGQENVTGARTIRAFNLKDRQIERFAQINNDVQNYGTKAEIRALISWPFAISFVNASAVVVVLAAGLIQWSGINFGISLSIGTIYAIFGYSYLILWSVYDLVFLYVYASRSFASRLRMAQVLYLNNPIANCQGHEFHPGPIRITDGAFKYNEQASEYTLQNINLTIWPNSRIGIIGATGSGKTTLLNLIARFYDLSKGVITINNQDLKTLNTSSLLRGISYAFQQPLLFADTIKNNIILANPHLSDIELQELLEQVQLGPLLQSKSEGFQFFLQEQGANLSGGQRQRINIARALARPAAIYLFDDALSALDNITEQQVLATICRRTAGAIVLISSQRISTIQTLDQIIVLDRGQISAVGTHAELLATNSIYQAIYKLQTRGAR